MASESSDKVITGLKRLFESEYVVVQNDLIKFKDEIRDLKIQVDKLDDENRRLRKELKDVVRSQFDGLDTNSNITQINDALLSQMISTGAVGENEVVDNLEKQLYLVKQERDNAMSMWQQTLNQVTRLEKENEIFKVQAAPQNVSNQIQMKQMQEEHIRSEAMFMEEVQMLKQQISKRNDEITLTNVHCNDLKILVESLRTQLQQKDHEKRDYVNKEFSYDEAVISLQNIINDLETKNQSCLKDNELLKEKKREVELKFAEIIRQRETAERKTAEIKMQLDESEKQIIQARMDKQRAQLLEQQHREDHERMHKAIGELMKEAAIKTKQEIEALKSIYNTNLEKLIGEYNLLEMDKNDLLAQLEKALRNKKSLEQELDKASNENIRAANRDNSNYDDLHRRFCLCEREKDETLIKLDARENELKQLQKMYESEKERSHATISDLKDKIQKFIFDSDKLRDDNLKFINEIDDLKRKLNDITVEKEQLQKKMTKQLQIYENQSITKDNESSTKFKNMEENHHHAMFELRQLLNMQQRMSNKWKEECHMITTQSEQKIMELRSNLDNLRTYNEKLVQDIQEAKQKEIENEKIISNYSLKMKALENRVKDAETQATEATKRIAKQVARDRLMLYEKHLLETELDKSKFNDTFSKGKSYFKVVNDEPTKLN